MKKTEITFITHQMDRSGAPTSLLRLMCEISSSSDFVINTIALRGGEQTNNFKAASSKLKVVSENFQTRWFENVFLFFKLFYFFLVFRHSSVILINSSVNLRAMVASIILRKRAFVYVRESENMLNSRLGFVRKRLLRFMTGVICVSQDTSKWVERYVPKSKLSVIYNGVSFTDINSVVSPIKSSIGRNKVVGIIGYLDIRKGIDRFYSLVDRALQSRDDIDFLIIGEIVDANYMHKISALQQKYVNRIRITGIVDDVHKYINECDLTVMLSREEALPRVVMESSFNAVPVLALNVAGTKEILPKDYIYLIKDYSEDAIFELLLSSLNDDLAKIGLDNFNFLRENFDIKVNVSKLIKRVTANGAY